MACLDNISIGVDGDHIEHGGGYTLSPTWGVLDRHLGLPTLRGGIDPGQLRFRAWVVGVV